MSCANQTQDILVLNQFKIALGKTDIAAMDLNPRDERLNIFIMSLIRSRKIILIVIPIFILVLVTILFFSRKAQINPVTGTAQHISLTPGQEIELGIESAPQLAIQFGGVSQNDDADEKVKRIGRKLISSSDIAKSPYQFDFHVLADSQSINAFSFPGGQIFITLGLFKKLKTDNEIATILSHQIGHVIGRHASQKLFKTSVFEGIVKSDTVFISKLPPRLILKYLSDFIKLGYDNGEENEADQLGFHYAVRAGFGGNSFLQALTGEPESNPEAKLFFEKHPNFRNRKDKLEEILQKEKN